MLEKLESNNVSHEKSKKGIVITGKMTLDIGVLFILHLLRPGCPFSFLMNSSLTRLYLIPPVASFFPLKLIIFKWHKICFTLTLYISKNLLHFWCGLHVMTGGINMSDFNRFYT